MSSASETTRNPNVINLDIEVNKMADPGIYPIARANRFELPTSTSCFPPIKTTRKIVIDLDADRNKGTEPGISVANKDESAQANEMVAAIQSPSNHGYNLKSPCNRMCSSMKNVSGE